MDKFEEYDKPAFAHDWQVEGLTTKQMSARYHIPEKTVGSRVNALKQAGLITQHRPRGGSYPHKTHRTPAPQMPEVDPNHPEVLAIFSEILHKLDTIQGIPPPPPRTPPGKRPGAVQWSARLSPDLIDAIKRHAALDGVPPSHLVERVLRRAFGMPE